MAVMREQFFECSFRSAHHVRATQVRAWTAADAKKMFLEMLAADGIDERGKVTAVAVRYARTSPLVVPQLPHALHA